METRKHIYVIRRMGDVRSNERKKKSFSPSLDMAEKCTLEHNIGVNQIAVCVQLICPE